MAAQFSQTTRSLASDTARYAYIAWACACVLVVGWTIWFFFSSVSVYEISNRARLEVRQAPHHVATLLASKVVASSLVIGKNVQAGDVLVELDASSERLRLREEVARVTSIPRQIASLRREIDARQRAMSEDLQSAQAAADAGRARNTEAEAAVAFAKDTESRFARLSATGGISAVEALRASSEAQKLSASKEALSAELRRTELDAKTRASQREAEIEGLRRKVASLEGDFATAQATVARLKIEIEKHLVRAPIAGRIGDAIPLYTGAYVAEGQRLATVVPAGDLIIVADFSPSLTLGRVQPGQNGHLRLDAFPWSQFGTVPATVSRVASEVRDNLVRVEFTPDPAAYDSGIMQHGLLGSIEVGVEEVSPATLVLRAAGLLLSTQAKDSTAIGSAR